MPDTSADVWRQVRLHLPMASVFQVKWWVQSAWRELCSRAPWSFLRDEEEFILNAQKTGTANVTRNSATVNGGTMAYATTDADRQFRVSTNGPIYTIITATASAYTLDRPYGGTTTTGASATVLDAYVTVPQNFQRFIAVLDPANNWQLRHWITEDEINFWDPQRSSTGSPWALASRRLITEGTASLIGRIQYELWPYSTTAVNYPYYYIKQADDLTDSFTFRGPLQNRGDILFKLALAHAAEWPGTEDRRNPYYDRGLVLSAALRREAMAMADQIEVQDQDVYPTWIEEVSRIRSLPFAPIDSRYLQTHDVPDVMAWTM